VRIFGHPLHPMLVHFPVAFWSLSAGCDLLGYFGVAEAWSAAVLLQALGLATAIPAMASGIADFGLLKDGAVATATRHMMLMGLAWTTYACAALAHLDGGTVVAEPAALAVVLSAAGFAIMSVGGWYGGQLVYRFGVGVHREGQ